jgi:hypothetical protein
MSLRASQGLARQSQPLAMRDCFVGLRPPRNDISLVLTATLLSYTLKEDGRHSMIPSRNLLTAIA